MVDALNSGTYTEIDDLINTFYSIDDFSGVVIVGHGDSILYHNEVGIADRSFDTPITINTKFSIGSITKSFTGYLIHHLIDEGLLEEDVPIINYYTDLPEDVGQVTIKQILGHLSGIWHYNKYENYRQLHFRKDQTVKEFVDQYIKDGLRRKPNQVRSYSSIGYDLLGLIAEKVTGKALSQLYGEVIFNRLDMESTLLLEEDVVISEYAKGYRYDIFRGYLNERYRHASSGYAGGGIVSSAPDLLKWSSFLLQSFKENPGLIFFQPILNNGKEEWEGYAFGFSTYLPMKNDTIRALWHEGQFGGNRTVFIGMPESDISIVVLSNTRGVPVMSISKNIIEILRGNPIPYPAKQSYISLMWDELSLGNVKSSINIYEDLKIRPGTLYDFSDPSELIYLGTYLQNQNRLADALEILELARINYPYDIDSRLFIAKINLLKPYEDASKAKKYLEEVLILDQDNEEAKSLMESLGL